MYVCLNVISTCVPCTLSLTRTHRGTYTHMHNKYTDCQFVVPNPMNKYKVGIKVCYYNIAACE